MCEGPDDIEGGAYPWSEKDREEEERRVEDARAAVAKGDLKGRVFGVALKVIHDRGTHNLSERQLRTFDMFVPPRKRQR